MVGMRAQQAARTRAHILDVAERLFATHGYDRTSLQAIADAAGVGKANVYHYFRTKDTILDAALLSAVGAVHELLAGAAQLPKGEQRARFVVRGYVELLVARRRRQPWMLGLSQQSRDRAVRRVVEELTGRATALVFDGPLNPAQRLLVSQLLALQDAVPRLESTSDEELRALLLTACDALLAMPGLSVETSPGGSSDDDERTSDTPS